MAKMKKRHYEGGRAMYEPSERKMESRDSHMLSEDHSAIANMPQGVKYHPWASQGAYLETHLDDTISGIDNQQHGDVGTANRHKSKSKY